MHSRVRSAEVKHCKYLVYTHLVLKVERTFPPCAGDLLPKANKSTVFFGYLPADARSGALSSFFEVLSCFLDL